MPSDPKKKKKAPPKGFTSLNQFMTPSSGSKKKKSSQKITHLTKNDKSNSNKPVSKSTSSITEQKRDNPASTKDFKNATKSKKKPHPQEKSIVLDKVIKEEDMLQKVFFEPNLTPIGDSQYDFELERESREAQKSWHLRILQKADEIIQDMEKGILLTVDYDGGQNKAFAKFYDTKDQKIKIWIDTTKHQSYCYHKDSEEELSQNLDLMDLEGFDHLETVKKYDLLEDKEIELTKIYGDAPSHIGGANGIREILGGAWESRIRYHHNFIYDNELIPGMPYKIEKGIVSPLEPEIDPILQQELFEVFKTAPEEIQEMAKVYQPVFSAPPGEVKRLAYDIEVEETPDGTLPDPMLAKFKVISVSFAATDGLKQVYCLDRDDVEIGTVPEDFPQDAVVKFFKDERELLKETFRLFWDYPIILTFNGDNFDNTYLYHRARRMKISEKINPIYVSRGGGMVTHNTDYKHAIHIDIFQFFANRSIKGYAFGGAYLKNSLEAVASALLGEGKVKHEGVLIGKMTLADLIHYNLMDSMLTLELTTFNNNLMWNLLIVIMRITRLPMQDTFRLQISAWIRSLIYSEHKRKNYLIPRMSELERRGKFSRNKTEKFQGAYVIDPVPGAHYNVGVLDFSSLYPSIIKTRNLSYETINCHHPECEDNFLPDSPYYTCTKRMGIFAYVVGFLRDVRVKWFKSLSNNKNVAENERHTAKVMAAALKVFINGSYGVFGSPVFPFYYLPVAESTTNIGRYSIQKTIDKSEEMGVKVLYGDTDSVFLLQPTEKQIKELVKWSEEKLDLDLELEKTYQFLALSGRKKNYIGVRQGGKQVDLKGLMAKKHNTPEFIKKRFNDVQTVLTKITDDESFKANREEIIQIIKQTNRLIGKTKEKGGFDIKDYGIMTALKKGISAYTKAIPQHVKAAQMLPEQEQKKLERGTFITYVKTRSQAGVKPVSLATLADIDYKKYKEMVRSTFEQVLDALGINYEEIQGIKKLSSFF
ncbi:DNA-directed DNA polymerase I [Candidatus Lokiarchaeum ossiferum]|uniref:DNA-directed DNA polymerase I n=1 Tax=Candidatus Lokiarchaeum ossiferum TaxID=2951803 RepID=UPI00352F5E3D